MKILRKKFWIIILAVVIFFVITVSIAVPLAYTNSNVNKLSQNKQYKLEYKQREQNSTSDIAAKIKLDAKYANKVVFAKFEEPNSVPKVEISSVNENAEAIIYYPSVTEKFARPYFLLTGLYEDDKATELILKLDPQINLRNITWDNAIEPQEIRLNKELSANKKVQLTFEDQNNHKLISFSETTDGNGIIRLKQTSFNTIGIFRLKSIEQDKISINLRDWNIRFVFASSSTNQEHTQQSAIDNTLTTVNNVNFYNVGPTSANVEFTLAQNNQIASEKEVKLFVLNIKNNTQKEAISTINNNKLVFNLNDLDSNSEYKINSTTYVDTAIKNPIYLPTELIKTFITKTKDISFDFSNFASKMKENEYKINIFLTSEDNILEDNQEVLVSLESQDKKIESKAKITKDANNKYKIEFVVSNLTANSIYTLDKIKFVSKPTKALENVGKNTDNIIYNKQDFAQNISFINEEDVKITLQREVDSQKLTDKHSSYKIKLKFSKLSDLYLNNKLSLEYHSSDNKIAQTSFVELKDSKVLEYILDLKDLEVNKEYTLKFLTLEKLDNSKQKTNFSVKDFNISDSLKISQTFSNFEVKSRTFDSVDAKIDINDDLKNSKVDFNQNKKIKVYYFDDSNKNKTLTTEGTIDQNGFKKEVNLTFSNLELNKKYQVDKIDVYDLANQEAVIASFNLFTPWVFENKLEIKQISNIDTKTGKLNISLDTNLDLNKNKFKLVLKNQENQQEQQLKTEKNNSFLFNKEQNKLDITISTIFNQKGKYLIEKLLLAKDENFSNPREILLSNQNKVLDIESLEVIENKVKEELNKLSDKLLPSFVNQETITNLVDEKYRKLLGSFYFQIVNNQSGQLKIKYHINYLANARFYEHDWKNLNKIIDDKELTKHWATDATQIGSWWLQYYKPGNVFLNGYYWFAWPGSKDIKFFVKPKTEKRNFVGQIKLKFKNDPSYFWPAKAGLDKYIKDPFVVNVTNKDGKQTKLSIKQQPIWSKDKSMVTYTFDVNDFIKQIEIVFPSKHNVDYVSIHDIFLTTTEKENK
ncbi:hypothetical protein [Mesomycoplasma hyorhinis]|uniref:hypothetical protein n=1 Tax=Mesomycoplasma hyorhinis TaxID=2100 RepID=UPI001C052707|nr:hypothetical protein [Mesomycoplasma hyorhinis]